MNIVIALALLLYLLSLSRRRGAANRKGAGERPGPGSKEPDWVDRLEELDAILED